MDTNGRSTATITTSDAQRRARWLTIFGAEQIPVMSAKPRWQVGRGEFREIEILAYDLDVSRLHWMSAQRAADRLNLTVDQLAGLPIKASTDITVTAVSPEWMIRPFALAIFDDNIGTFNYA